MKTFLARLLGSKRASLPLTFMMGMLLPAAGWSAVLSVPASLNGSSIETRTTATTQGTALVLGTNATVTNRVNFPTVTTYKFDITAYGTPVGGVYPTMNVLIDGILLRSFSVNSRTARVYSFTHPLQGAGVRNLQIRFTNDASSSTENRNLYVNSVAVAFAVTAANVPSTRLATQMGIKTAGRVASDGSWLFQQNGALGNTYNLVGGRTYRFDLRARGLAVNGVYPSVRISIDGAILQTLSINSSTERAFSFNYALSGGGTREVRIEFTNHATGRDLYVRSLALSTVATPTAPTPTPTPVPTPTPTASTAVFRTNASVVDPAMAVTRSTVKVSTSLQADRAITGVTVDIQIRDSRTSRAILQRSFPAQTFAARVPNVYTFNAALPSTATAGTYYLTVATFNSNFTVTHYWNNNAAPLLLLDRALTPATGLQLTGVNLSGAEFNASRVGARLWTDYVYPSTREMDYYASQGMKIIRLPFNLNRLQPTRLGNFNQAELDALDDVVQYARTRGLTVILDPHNYGTMQASNGTSYLIGEPQVPVSHFADFWRRLAGFYRNQSNVYFNLMNEPSPRGYTDAAGVRRTVPYTAAQWRVAAVAAINAIRATGATQKILIPGASWTGAHSWISSGNAAAWAGFRDINFAYEVHQYLDRYSSGMEDSCTVGGGATRLAAFTAWARAQNADGFLGEVGWAPNAGCMIEGHAIMTYMTQNRDVWLGWTYWAAGPWMVDYHYTIEPVGAGTPNLVEQPNMTVIRDFIR